MNKSMTIAEYSMLALTLTGFQKLNAEVIYTDNEDIVLDIDDEAYFLDIDGNGTEDFKLFKFSGTFIYSTSSSTETELRRFNSIRMRPLSSLGAYFNSIAGWSTSTYWGYPSYWPYALEMGDVINEELEFRKNYGAHFLASRLDVIVASGTATGIEDAGYWYPSLEDRYVGVHFRDIDNNYHYGWIRCSVLDSAEVLIIKDYAYETEVNHPIVAGDTVSYVGVENPQINDLVTIYSFGSHVYIKSNLEQVKAAVIITDMSGKNVFSGQCTTPFLDIDLSSLTTGHYTVILEQDKTLSSKQVFIATY